MCSAEGMLQKICNFPEGMEKQKAIKTRHNRAQNDRYCTSFFRGIYYNRSIEAECVGHLLPGENQAVGKPCQRKDKTGSLEDVQSAPWCRKRGQNGSKNVDEGCCPSREQYGGAEGF